MTNVPQQSQLAWQCRRGMLELDVMLLPFLEQHFDKLTDQQKILFSQLLDEADPDIYSWLMGYAECDHADLCKIIQLIKTQGSLLKKSL